MFLNALTFVHVVISLIGIGSGFLVLYGLIRSIRMDNWTAVFLTTTAATSATGYLFPFHRLLPSHIVGLISLTVLALAILARYAFHLEGSWLRTYIVTAVMAQYLDVFVLIAQLFQKVPALKSLAPTQSEPPFLVTQLAVLLLFVWLGFRAWKPLGGALRTA